MQHEAVKVQIRQADVTSFQAAQAAAVEQGQKQAVLEPLGGDEQALYLPEYDGQGFVVFEAGQLDAFVLESFHAKDEAQAIDSKLEIGLGGRVVVLAQQVEVIVDLVGVELGRQEVEVQSQFGQVAAVVG